MRALNKLRLLAATAAVATLGACMAAPATRHTTPAARDYKDPRQLSALLSERLEPYFLVDVRTAQEYREGHIPTAINIPYDLIAASPPTRNTTALIVVYCASGGRSSKAAKALEGLGYLRVVDFGAIRRWVGPLRYSADPGDCPCR
jgi:phage shock protein E